MEFVENDGSVLGAVGVHCIDAAIRSAADDSHVPFDYSFRYSQVGIGIEVGVMIGGVLLPRCV